MKVLVADLVSQAAMDEMTANGIQVIYNHQLTGPTLTQALSQHSPQILVVRSTKVTSEHLSASPSLQLVVRAGAGTDNIDSAQASRKGIFVGFCPGKNSIAVAELVMGHMISIDRRIAQGVNLLKQGKWNKGLFADCKGLKGRKLGIIGIGAIGREVSVRAKSFGMTVCGTDPFVSAEQAESMGIQYFGTPEEVAQVSDIITFHVPATPSTTGMIGTSFISHCKPDVVLINTSRGEIVNQQELLQALEEKPGMWYGCDVYQGEPLDKQADFVHPLAQHPRVNGTHHVGASTKQAQEAIGQEALRIILQYSQTRTVDPGNLINLQRNTQGQFSLILRHYGQERVLVDLLVRLKDAGAKILEIQNKAFRDSVSFTATVNVLFEDEAGLQEIANSIAAGSEDAIHCALVKLQ